MRDVLNLLFGFVFLAVVGLGVASQFDPTDSSSHAASTHLNVDGHPENCVACRERGKSLPEIISDETIHVESYAKGPVVARHRFRRPRQSQM